MRLTERKKTILREVVTRFIDDAEPVSSGKVAAGPGMGISSATIRREMSELEKMGYLAHPHTSAGRVPTDRGYRFYVDNIVEEVHDWGMVSCGNIPDIKLEFSHNMEIEAILKKSSEMLAELTNYLSMIVAPAIYQSRFKHIELLKFDAGNFLMVLITDTGRVYKRNFILEGKYTDLDLQGAANIMNSQLRDKNIMDISSGDLKVEENDFRFLLLIKKILELIKDCIKENLLYNRIFVHGTSVILRQPEFIDLKKIQDMLGVIENEYLLMKMLLDFSDENRFVVKIGSELVEGGTGELSLIASKYRIGGNSSGAIGILGPKRMNYQRVINILEIFRSNLTRVFDSRA
ncbi:MAG: heat-inducible transcription repressor HrcA [Actinobacteria bacterium]|nr:heat-inducible transcription repressor HrcA [Actinomycetota bacterium]